MGASAGAAASWDALLRLVFPSCSPSGELSLEDVESLLDAELDPLRSAGPKPSGRFGRERVSIDQLGGRWQGASAPLGDLEGNDAFTTWQGTVAVYSGRWFYEVTLCTQGIVQIGWTTPDAHFTMDHGVGDVPTSFAYDGCRVLKWSNGDRSVYGAPWVAGDVVGCAIDLDAGVISYFLNGAPLGDAAYDIPRGRQGLAYIPAISAGHHERVSPNFGRQPFLYPQPSYAPVDICLDRPGAAAQALAVLEKLSLLATLSAPRAMVAVIADIVCARLGTLLNNDRVRDYVVIAAALPWFIKALAASPSTHSRVAELLHCHLEPRAAEALWSTARVHLARLVRCLPLISPSKGSPTPAFPITNLPDLLHFIVASGILRSPGVSEVTPDVLDCFFAMRSVTRPGDTQRSASLDTEVQVAEAFDRVAELRGPLLEILAESVPVNRWRDLVAFQASRTRWGVTRHGKPSAPPALFAALLYASRDALDQGDVFPAMAASRAAPIAGSVTIGRPRMDNGADDGGDDDDPFIVEDDRVVLDDERVIVEDDPVVTVTPQHVFAHLAIELFFMTVSKYYDEAREVARIVATGEQGTKAEYIHMNYQQTLMADVFLRPISRFLRFLCRVLTKQGASPARFARLPESYIGTFLSGFEHFLLGAFGWGHASLLDEFVTALVYLLSLPGTFRMAHIEGNLLQLTHDITTFRVFARTVESNAAARASLLPAVLRRGVLFCRQTARVFAGVFQGALFGHAPPPVPHLARDPSIEAVMYWLRTGPERCASTVIQSWMEAAVRDNPTATDAFVSSLLTNAHRWATSLFDSVGSIVAALNSTSDAAANTCVGLYRTMVDHTEVIQVIARHAGPRGADIIIASDLHIARLADLLLVVLARTALDGPESAPWNALIDWAQSTQRRTADGTDSEVTSPVGPPPLLPGPRFPALAAIPRAGPLLALLGALCGLRRACGASFGERVCARLVTQGEITLAQVQGMIDGAFLVGRCGVDPREAAEAHDALIEIASWSDRAVPPDVPEDLLCAICYVRRIERRFAPCGHSSCALCIGRHMLNTKTCFFCKAKIAHVDPL